MTIHPDILREMIATGGDFQDAYRAAWEKGIPREMRKVRRAPADGKAAIRAAKAVSDAIGVAQTPQRFRQSREAQRDEVAALVAQGLTDSEAAKRIGVSRRCVGRIIRDFGLTRPEKIGKAARHWEDIRRMRRAGLSFEAISRAIGVSDNCIRKEWHRRGGKP